jgi:hypothetical protein
MFPGKAYPSMEHLIDATSVTSVGYIALAKLYKLSLLCSAHPTGLVAPGDRN